MNTPVSSTEHFFKDKVLGHPSGLFVLFFTEMWERFSYYGMRALFVLFLTSTIAEGGWAWDNAKAVSLYGFYTMSVYLTPVLGGLIADKFLGYRWAVILGALLMTLGHASLAFETPMFFYIGLGLIICGNGLFKPNMTSIVSNMYKNHQDKKDGAYSIFYMGVNAGSFLGIMLCGYLGEKVSWSWGFGLAGIFMFIGMLQFYFTQKIFGDIGLKPAKKDKIVVHESEIDHTPANIVRDRFIALFIFCFFIIFFWAAFEQAGGSMTIFAKNNTQRVLEGNYAIAFKIVDTLLSVVPLGIITYVLIKLFGKTFKRFTVGNIILACSFVMIWGIMIWKLNREFSNNSTEIAASWFNILNSLYIICFAPVFSKWWESKFNLPAAMKFGLGLVFLGIGFGFLAFGSLPIADNPTVKVSMIWLVLAYLFHTLGELSSSPVGLSYVSKLVPAKFIGLMFGVYYLFLAMGNLLAGKTGSLIDKITEQYSLSDFFLIFTIIPIIAGILVASLHPLIKKLMHGVK